jgi:methyl-accepting chemotaxis protein/methyl-accepting chemotaxis protein-1 (serine sensor receptor)
MSRLTIGQRFLVAGAVMSGLLMLSGAFSFWSSASIHGRLDETAKGTVKRVELAHRVDGLVARLLADERGAIDSSLFDDKVLSAETRKDLADHLAEARQLLPELQALMRIESGRVASKRAIELLEAWAAADKKVIAIVDSGDPAAASALAEKESLPVTKELEATIAKIVANQQTFLAEDVAGADRAYTWNRWGILLLLAISAAVSGGVWRVVVGIMSELRGATVELRQGAEQVATAAGEVATSAQSLSQGATEQAASLEETSASMEEMASMTRQNAEHSRSAATLMVEVDGRVRESNEALGEMVTSMSAIHDSSQKISKIIKTIDEIAFQTNILALNAAVEAARAGEAGMGFAVVADEVRNLAQHSATAARDTSALIEESMTRAQRGSETVDQVTTAIASITTAVGKVKTLVEEVSGASEQQAQGIDQVSQAIAQMEQVTQQTAATAEESAASSEELNSQAETTRAVVARLEQLVGADGAVARPKAAPPAAPAAVPARSKIVDLAKGRQSRVSASATPPADTGTYGSF